MKYLFAFLLFSSWSFAQTQPKPTPPQASNDAPKPAAISLVTRSYGDSVVVRWATDNSILWKMSLEAGYRLTRKSITAQGKVMVDYQIVVKPWSVEEWRQKHCPNDTLAAIATQLVWGKTKPIRYDEEVTLDKLMRQQNLNDTRLMMALILADENTQRARGMALGWVDKKVVKGTQYVYSIRSLADAKLYPADTAFTVLRNDGPYPRPEMPPVYASAGDKVATLSWDRYIAEKAFSSYYIERSDDGGRTFKRITIRPWVSSASENDRESIQYSDSLSTNYKSYQYRVVGNTAFGEPSLPSKPVAVKGIDMEAPSGVTMLTAEHQLGSRVRLRWQHPNAPSDLAGYLVAKAVQSEGPFVPLTKKLLPTNQREFIDTTAIPTLPAYYVVVSVDTSKNSQRSLPVYCMFKDVKGPTRPTGLQGYIDTTGLVRVVWNPNLDQDLMGYKVLIANDPTHVFTSVTDGYLQTAVFNDTTTLQTLTRHLYVRVVAYDKHFNPSLPSDILTLTRPDKIPPITPVFAGFTASDSSITMNWVSGSDDVKELGLYRRNASSERWRELKKLPTQTNTYTDKALKPNTDYQYMLVAVDSAGLRSPESFPLNTATLRTIPKSIKQLNAALSADKKAVNLTWKAPADNCYYIIYKALGTDYLQSYDKVARLNTFTDRNVLPGVVNYAVKVLYADGSESALSQPVRVEIK
ncbi:MAG: hypothetical protein U0Y10_10985 [Spirosomataceae bacterium]